MPLLQHVYKGYTSICIINNNNNIKNSNITYNNNYNNNRIGPKSS